ncbi:MAG TPA: response regulator [Armatimonadota bacterium]|nr:response regulator [Armatimonadota bacterium]
MESQPAMEVLLVDDDPDFVHALGDILAGEGYRVTGAANGQEALEHLRRQAAPALILLNLSMPVMNGWALVAELRQRPELSAIPVILLSGVADAQHQAAALGAVACVPKPVDVSRLLAAMRRHCV